MHCGSNFSVQVTDFLGYFRPFQPRPAAPALILRMSERGVTLPESEKLMVSIYKQTLGTEPPASHWALATGSVLLW